MYVPTFVNANNPQLRLLAEFLAVMANTNEEATLRVFKKIKIECISTGIRVYGPTNSLDIFVDKREREDEYFPDSEERQEMLLGIFHRLKELKDV